MSTGLPFEAGQKIQVAMAGAEDIEAFDVEVIDVKEDAVILRGGEDTAHLLPGTAVMVRHPGDEESVCWGRLERVSRHEENYNLQVQGIRCDRMEQRGAPRKEANLSTIVSYVVVGEGGTKETRKSLGRIINASRTGVRLRSRSPLVRGTLVHLQIDFGTNEPTVAIGQVVRVVAGSEFDGGGFEVGISFARILQGVEQLYDFLGDVETGSHSTEEAEVKESDVQSSPQATSEDAAEEPAA